MKCVRVPWLASAVAGWAALASLGCGGSNAARSNQPLASVYISCPADSEVIIDMMVAGGRTARKKLTVGEHRVKCDDAIRRRSFTRTIEVVPGENTFNFSGESF